MTVPSASQSAARLSPVHEGSAAPPVITLDAPMADPAGWTDEHRAEVLALVTEQGSVRIRGLGLADPGQVGAVLGELSSALVGDEEAFAQRRRYAPGIYSSAAWPDHERMCMHHELSYRLSVPTLLVLGCLTAPSSGGETGLADAAAVLADLPADLVEKFATEGWLLLRTYGGDIGPSLADAFGTEDRGSIEAYCRVNAIDYHWRPDGGLSTRQRRPAVVTHPVTGRRCWFNQVAFLSEWTIEEEIREFLVDMYGADGLPFTTAFGNGDAIEADLIATLNEVYDAHTVREPWQAGDLLLLDNIGTAHSREAFEGDREIVVAMADPVTPSPASRTDAR